MGSSKVVGIEAKEPSRVVNAKGLHWLTAAVFIIGDMAGGGMMALPGVFVTAGLWPGTFLVCLLAVLTTYTAVQLSDCWIMLQSRWSKYRNECRRPYGEIGYRACGPMMRSFMAFMICVTQFGFATVLVLLASKNLTILLDFFFGLRISFCFVIVIVGLVIWPATMLKSPMHFWQVAVFAAASSSTAVVLLLIGMTHDAPVCTTELSEMKFDPVKFCMDYGTLVFAFGGHSAFPTIQHDMRKPKHFNRSIYLSFALILVYYLLVSIGGFVVYGGSVGDAIIQSIQLPWVQQTVNIMIAIHVITTVVIVFSPLTQQVESMLHTSQNFGWQRFLVRTVLFWIIIFVALSMPSFGPMMDLIGASTMSLMSLILPGIFYLYLKASHSKREEDISQGRKTTDSADDEFVTWRHVITYIPRTELTINAIIISFGIIGGIVATVASLMKLVSAEVAAPCYVQYFRDGALPMGDSLGGTINCCGAFHNLTVSGVDPNGYCATTIF